MALFRFDPTHTAKGLPSYFVSISEANPEAFAVLDVFVVRDRSQKTQQEIRRLVESTTGRPPAFVIYDPWTRLLQVGLTQDQATTVNTQHVLATFGTGAAFTTERARQAEEQRLTQERARQAEEQRLTQERVRQAEEQRLTQERVRQAEEQRLTQERVRQAEEQQKKKQQQEEREARERTREEQKRVLEEQKRQLAEEEQQRKFLQSQMEEEQKLQTQLFQKTLEEQKQLKQLQESQQAAREAAIRRQQATALPKTITSTEAVSFPPIPVLLPPAAVRTVPRLSPSAAQLAPRPISTQPCPPVDVLVWQKTGQTEDEWFKTHPGESPFVSVRATRCPPDTPRYGVCVEESRQQLLCQQTGREMGIREGDIPDPLKLASVKRGRLEIQQTQYINTLRDLAGKTDPVSLGEATVARQKLAQVQEELLPLREKFLEARYKDDRTLEKGGSLQNAVTRIEGDLAKIVGYQDTVTRLQGRTDLESLRKFTEAQLKLDYYQRELPALSELMKQAERSRQILSEDERNF